ncbi:hypothetical protein SY88_21140 [Clostridiales bacterium PH28_bin88]|nr:hypothetical protein SY88_21140 [Clostridiales bacterium PH28_bin88]
MSWIAFLESLPAKKPGHSKALLSHCGRVSPYVEPVDARRVFLDLGGGIVPPVGLAGDLASRLVPACAPRVTLALAHSKLTARAVAAAFAADRLPPDSPGMQIHQRSYGDILVVLPGQEARCLAPLPVDYLWPLEPQLRERLRLLGLTTIGLVAGVPESDLCRQFPADGPLISLYCKGLDHNPVYPLYPPGRFTFSVPVEEVTGKTALRPFLILAATSLSSRLKSSNCACRRVILWLFTGQHPPARQAQAFPQAQQDEKVLLDTLNHLLDKAGIAAPVTQLGVTATGLTPLQARQLTLFTPRGDRMAAGSGNATSFRRLAAELQQRYPRAVRWGRALFTSRREQMLALVDPYRSSNPGKTHE